MTRIGNLAFNYYDGGCNYFSKFGILFCFGRWATQECHSMKISEKGKIIIKKEISSDYKHGEVESLASYKQSPFVTGSFDPTNSKTELLNISKMQWETKADFPSVRYSGQYFLCFAQNHA